MVSFIHRAGKESVWRPFRVPILVSRGHTILFPPSATDDICCIGWQGCLFAPHCPHIATGGHVASDASVRCQGDCQHTETRGPGESHQTGNTSWHPGTQNSQTQKYSTIQVIRGSLRFLSWIEGEQNFTWNRFYVIMLDFPNTKSFSIYMLKLSSFFLGCIIKEITRPGSIRSSPRMV